MLPAPYSPSPAHAARRARIGWGLLVVLGGGLGLAGVWIVLALANLQPEPAALHPPILARSPARSAAAPGAPSPGWLAARYLAAWTAGDHAAMHALLSPAAAARIDAAAFRRRYQAIADEAMIVSLLAQPLPGADPAAASQPFSLTVESARAGRFTEQGVLRFTLTDGQWGIDWQPSSLFSALRAGDRVTMEDEVAVRGRIVDRYGHILAQQTEVATIGVAPAALDDREATLARVADALGLDAAAVRQQVAASDPTWFVPLADLPWRNPPAAARQLLDLAGVEARVRLERRYPLGATAAHVLGSVRPVTAADAEMARARGLRSGDWVGAAGVEALAEAALAGRPGGRLLIVAPDGAVRAVLAERRATPGRDIVLTLDLSLQLVAEAALGDRPGGIVALDPATGAVRALVSRPAIDPNLFVRDPAAAASLARDEQRRPLLNRASGLAYPPGEPFGLVAAAAGMMALGLPADATVACPAGVPGAEPGQVWRNRRPAPTGSLTLSEALASGCMTAVQAIADQTRRVDPAALPAMARRLGFEAPAGLAGFPDIAGQAPETVGGTWGPVETLAVAAGQGGVETTALQVARAYAAAANGGTLWAPRLIERLAGEPDAGAGPDVPPSHLDAALGAALRSIVLPPPRPMGLASGGGSGHDTDGVPWLVAGSGVALAPGIAPAWAVMVLPPPAGLALVVIVERGGDGPAVAAPLAWEMIGRWMRPGRGPN